MLKLTQNTLSCLTSKPKMMLRNALRGLLVSIETRRVEMTSMKRKKAKLKTLFKTLNKSLLNKKESQLTNNKHPKKRKMIMQRKEKEMILEETITQGIMNIEERIVVDNKEKKDKVEEETTKESKVEVANVTKRHKTKYLKS